MFFYCHLRELHSRFLKNSGWGPSPPENRRSPHFHSRCYKILEGFSCQPAEGGRVPPHHARRAPPHSSRQGRGTHPSPPHHQKKRVDPPTPAAGRGLSDWTMVNGIMDRISRAITWQRQPCRSPVFPAAAGWFRKKIPGREFLFKTLQPD